MGEPVFLIVELRHPVTINLQMLIGSQVGCEAPIAGRTCVQQKHSVLRNKWEGGVGLSVFYQTGRQLVICR